MSSVKKRTIRPMLIDTLERASQLVLPTKGRISKANRIQSFFISSIILVIIICAIGISLSSWIWCLLVLAIYGLAMATIVFMRKSKTAIPLQSAHLQLSLFLRAENNRFYIRNGVELRPGFLAKWIEVSAIESKDPSVVIQNIV